MAPPVPQVKAVTPARVEPARIGAPPSAATQAPAHPAATQAALALFARAGVQARAFSF